jgi:hypothetical protein
MGQQIEDGTGTGARVQVTKDNQLLTFAVSENRVADVSKRSGDAFLIASDFISLTTTGSFNGLLYIKNNNAKSLFIQTIRTCSDAASASMQLRMIKNPTTGTLISDANAADATSSNLGSSNTFDGDAYTASGDGKTVTDGDNLTQFINRSPGHSIQDYEGAIVIPKGQSLAITCKPSAATDICIEVQCWYEE